MKTSKADLFDTMDWRVVVEFNRNILIEQIQRYLPELFITDMVPETPPVAKLWHRNNRGELEIELGKLEFNTVTNVDHVVLLKRFA